MSRVDLASSALAMILATVAAMQGQTASIPFGGIACNTPWCGGGRTLRQRRRGDRVPRRLRGQQRQFLSHQRCGSRTGRRRAQSQSRLGHGRRVVELHGAGRHAPGLYTIQVRVASPGTGGTFHLELDGISLTGSLTVPDTGDWQLWTTMSAPAASLAAGTHVLRLAMDSVGSSGWVGNFNWVSLMLTSPRRIHALRAESQLPCRVPSKPRTSTTAARGSRTTTTRRATAAVPIASATWISNRSSASPGVNLGWVTRRRVVELHGAGRHARALHDPGPCRLAWCRRHLPSRAGWHQPDRLTHGAGHRRLAAVDDDEWAGRHRSPPAGTCCAS